MTGHDEFYYCHDCKKWSAVAYWRWNGVWHIRCQCCGRYVDHVSDEDRVIAAAASAEVAS